MSRTQRLALPLLSVSSLLLLFALLTATTRPVQAAGGCSANVATTQELNDAIGCFNSLTTPQSVTITLIANIDIVTATTPISNATTGVFLNIDGGSLTIDGQLSFRPLTILTGTVEIERLTILKGYSGTGAQDGNDGGGIWNGGHLTLHNTVLQNNIAGEGSLEDGDGASGRGGDGGAIYNVGWLAIDDSRLIGNQAGTGGQEGGNGVSGRGGDGGAIYNVGWLAIDDSTLIGNRAGTGGREMGNGASGRGGDGGGVYNTSILTITNMTIADNQAGNGGAESGRGFSGRGGDGGGVFNTGTLSAINILVLENRSGNPGSENNNGSSGRQGNGAGFGNVNGHATLINATIVRNETAGDGGGLHNDGSSPTIVNTIVQGNSPSGAPISNQNGSLPAISFSLIESSGGSTAWDAAIGVDGGNNLDADPSFVALGLDYTLRNDSPAIDAGNNLSNTVPLDLAGETRIIDGDGDLTDTIDMGAFELNPSRSAVLSVRKSVSPTVAASGDTVTYTVHITNSGDRNAWDVVVTDTLPAALGFVTGSTVVEPVLGIAGDAPRLLEGLSLAPGGGVTLTYRAVISAEFSGTLTNHVTVSTTAITETVTDTATLTVLHPCDIFVFPATIGTTAELNEAITCFNRVTAPDTYTVTMAGWIWLSEPSVPIENEAAGVRLHLVGNGHGLSGNGDYRVLTIEHDSRVLITDMIVENGRITGDGAGIYNAGTLTMTGSTVQYNRAETGNGAGIYNAGTLMMTDSTLYNNHAQGEFSSGGGLYSTGHFYITDSLLDSNDAAFGEALMVASQESVSRTAMLKNEPMPSVLQASQVERHRTLTSGITVFVESGALQIIESALTNNRTDGSTVQNNGELSIIRSTIANNSNISFGAGAIQNRSSGSLTLINSTVSGNEADVSVALRGDPATGAISNAGMMTITHSTIVNNRVVGLDDAPGGLLNLTLSENLHVTNSIIAQNGDGSNCVNPMTGAGISLMMTVVRGRLRLPISASMLWATMVVSDQLTRCLPIVRR